MVHLHSGIEHLNNVDVEVQQYFFFYNVTKLTGKATLYLWFIVFSKYVEHSATVRSKSGGDVSDLFRNFVYKNTCRKILNFLKIFVLFVLAIYFSEKNSPLSKIGENSHKSNKIFQNF